MYVSRVASKRLGVVIYFATHSASRFVRSVISFFAASHFSRVVNSCIATPVCGFEVQAGLTDATKKASCSWPMVSETGAPLIGVAMSSVDRP